MLESDLVILPIKARHGFSKNGLAMIDVRTIDRSKVSVDILARGAASCICVSGVFETVVLIDRRKGSVRMHAVDDKSCLQSFVLSARILLWYAII